MAFQKALRLGLVALLLLVILILQSVEGVVKIFELLLLLFVFLFLAAVLLQDFNLLFFLLDLLLIQLMRHRNIL